MYKKIAQAALASVIVASAGVQAAPEPIDNPNHYESASAGRRSHA